MAISPESAKIWEAVKENRARLDSCKRHLWLYEKLTLGQPIKCEHCGGTMQVTDAGMYVQGYVAAGGNADDVWPGWFNKRGKG